MPPWGITLLMPLKGHLCRGLKGPLLYHGGYAPIPPTILLMCCTLTVCTATTMTLTMLTCRALALGTSMSTTDSSDTAALSMVTLLMVHS